MDKDKPKAELANQFASLSTDGLRTTFDDLNAAILKRADVVSRHILSLDSSVDDLLPFLGEMQSLLSQRGSNRKGYREACLPTWTKWFKNFKTQTGLSFTIRAVQKQLAKLRGAKKTKKSAHHVHLSTKTQSRLLKVNMFANEMVAAIEHGVDYSEPLREYKRFALDTGKLAALVEGTPETEVESQVAPLQVAPASPPSPEVETETAAASESLPSPSPADSIPVPKHGDWSGLVANVNKLCGKHLKAVLAELDAEVAATALEKFAQKLAQTYCSYEHGLSELRVTVNVLSRKASEAEKRKYGLVHGAA